jgi:Tfp pilus assembly protein PilF
MRLLKSIHKLLGNYQLKSGLYHYYRGESKQAIEFLTKVMQAPDSPESDKRMAVYYLTQTYIEAAEKSEEAKNLQAAVEGYREALALTPDYPDIHFRMGGLYARFGLSLEAIECFRRAITLHAGYFEARVQIAFLLLENGQKDEAMTEFAAARDLAVRAIDEPFEKARAALAKGDGRETEEWMRETFLRRPESFAFHYRRALRFLTEGQNERAVEDFRLASQFNPNFADVHNYIGVALGELLRWEESIAAFRRALEANPEYPFARLNLAFALAEAGHDRHAVEELRAFLAHEPSNEPALAKLDELSAQKKERTRVQG